MYKVFQILTVLIDNVFLSMLCINEMPFSAHFWVRLFFPKIPLILSNTCNKYVTNRYKNKFNLINLRRKITHNSL